MPPIDSPQAIPVRVRHRTLRQMCVEHDESFQRDSEDNVEYEFTKRKFKGRYRTRGPYAED